MSSDSAGTADFLSELNESDSLAALRSAHSEKSVLVFKVGTQSVPVRTFIDNFLDKRVLFPSTLKELKLPANQEISIKFNVGTEVYFIKTNIKTHLNRYYFDMSSKVIQLKRRKEPRYLIPKKLNQKACVIVNTARQTELPSTAIDISLSGIRYEFKSKQDVPAFKRDDIILIKFQIYKRAEIECMAIVRFFIKNSNTPTLLGLEFADITDVQKKRIAGIIEDVVMASSITKK